MANFKIEVELDWLDEESLDDAIQRQVISGLQDRLVQNLESKLSNTIAEKVQAKATVIADSYVEKLVEAKLEDIQIPQKESNWSSQVTYTPLTEFIGKRFENAIASKTLDEYGQHTSYDRDKKYSIAEYLTRNYIAKELNEKVSDMIREAKDKAEQTLISNLEQNLQQQLHADMLKRLNIPELLKGLQNTIDYEEGK